MSESEKAYARGVGGGGASNGGYGILRGYFMAVILIFFVIRGR